jgi:putative transposase
MARQPRFRLPGYPQHIVQRGNDRQACFFANSDYHYYLDCLAAASELHTCDVHAYVLMTNHVHLLVTPNTPDGISKLMQAVGRRYVKKINTRYQRTGTLWEGRYRATLIDTDEYLLACYRYIELNPVRAGLVSEPSLYPWSSYGVHIGKYEYQLIRDHSVFLNLGENDAARRRAYGQLFESELSEKKINNIREATKNSRPLGNRQFEIGINVELGRASNSKAWGGHRAGAGRRKDAGKESSGSDPLDSGRGVSGSASRSSRAGR